MVHNAAVGSREPARVETAEGLAHVFAIDVLAPYLLTALLPRPDRLLSLSSGMQGIVSADLSDLQWTTTAWNGSQAYADSKLLDVVLAFAAARRWPDVLANAVDPAATVSGHYWSGLRQRPAQAVAADPAVQGALLTECARLTGTAWPDWTPG